MKAIRILVVDDHPVVRKGISSYLSKHNRFVVVGEAENGLEALAKAQSLSADVVLMDNDMPKLDGLSATQLLRQKNPRVKVIIFALRVSAQGAQRVLASGASGFLSKTASLEDLVQTIKTVAEGGNCVESNLAQTALRQLAGGNGYGPERRELSVREREVLVAIADGLSNKEISTRLGIEVRTVETHRERVMRKLNIHSVAGLTRFALIEGLTALPESTDSFCHPNAASALPCTTRITGSRPPIGS